MQVEKYLSKVLSSVKKRNGNEPEFIQAVTEVFTSVLPLLEKRQDFIDLGIPERLVEPERTVTFRVPWVDDNGKCQVNRGYRVQFNSAIGPYKGGLRFHPSVNLGIMKFLAFEQVFKNALTTLPMGGAKGGSDFDPKGKSDNEIMRFCQAFITELYKYIGANEDVPAGDIGVGEREIGYMFGQYKKIVGKWNGTFSGKGQVYGGSSLRKEATGYGLCYFAEEMLNKEGDSFKGKTVVISGSGNVAVYALKKAKELGATVVAMSDSNGYVFDANGIDETVIKQIKEIEKLRIKEYLKYRPKAVYGERSKEIFLIPCDIVMPCATQNEIDEKIALTLVKNGCKAVAEGANMPSTPKAVKIFLDNNVLFAPSKAANAGGVTVSGFEMSQNAMFLSWSESKIDEKLKNTMKEIFKTCSETAKAYGKENNLPVGANIAGFIRVAEAMKCQGYC